MPAGHHSQKSYGSGQAEQPTEVEDGRGYETSHEYDDVGNRRRPVAPLGRVTT